MRHDRHPPRPARAPVAARRLVCEWRIALGRIDKRAGVVSGVLTREDETLATPRRVLMSSTVHGIDVRPFQVEIPGEALDDVRRRIAATRWPSKELVGDRSQGVQLATIRELARYWTTDYDFGRVE